MKTKYAAWANLSARRKLPRAPIKIRDLPGYDSLAAKITLYAPHKGPWPPELDEASDAFSLRHFGLRRSDTNFRWPEDGPGIDWAVVNRKADAWDARFETIRLDDAGAVELLLRHGVDARDANGAPLKGVHLLLLQIEAAAKGMAGRMPDPVAVNAERFGINLAAEAEAHMTRKRSARRP